MRLLVYAYRDWSFKNIEPILNRFIYERWWFERGDMPDISKFDAVITCEPHIDGWRKIYPEWNGKIPIIGLQQTLYWIDCVRPNATWLFDWYLVWGKQMFDVAMAHGCDPDRMIITGSPRFDAFFAAKTEDKGFTLILGGGGGDQLKTFPQPSCPFMYIPHPVYDGGRMYPYSEEMMRIAGRVMFRTTGGGIIPMIMNKPVRIMPLFGVDDKARLNGYTRFMKSKLYGVDGFGTDEEFVRWSVTGPDSCERMFDAIHEIVK